MYMHMYICIYICTYYIYTYIYHTCGCVSEVGTQFTAIHATRSNARPTLEQKSRNIYFFICIQMCECLFYLCIRVCMCVCVCALA